MTQLTVLFSYSSPGYRDASDTKCHTIYTLIVEIISWYMCKAPYKSIFSTWRIWCSANWSLESLLLLSPKKYEVFSAAQELYNVKKLKMIKTATTRWLSHERTFARFWYNLRPRLLLPLLYQVVKTKTFIDFPYRTASFILCCLQRSIHLKREGRGCKSQRIRRSFIPFLQGQ